MVQHLKQKDLGLYLEPDLLVVDGTSLYTLLVYLLDASNLFSQIVTNIKNSYRLAFKVPVVVSIVNVLMICAVKSLFVIQVYFMLEALKRKEWNYVSILSSSLLASAVFVLHVVEVTCTLRGNRVTSDGAPRIVRWRVNFAFHFIRCLHQLLEYPSYCEASCGNS